ncbi:patatin-like phospholipase family protein [Rhizobium sp. L1K21]|uniref:patatin-like phospholipase family protein n=1 Tax=Rhizobium sp. L1K21 TaxID=2954933 RepID=UPI0020936791|nr:patatin-like phospholipase family protein [Rhizobium sp. L1K21]MCO6185908.1 patatin-like phospholipase family protein [Rhizobium sp. L1K21]
MTDPLCFDAIGFAGGGNRCYWQSGFWEAFNGLHPQKPAYYVTVSAGAYHAAMNLAGIGHQVRSAAFEFAARNLPDSDWSRVWKGKSPFVVGELFRTFLTDHFNQSALDALKAQSPILMQAADLPAWMPPSIGSLGSIGAYQIEKLLTGGAHSKAGRYLGLKPRWLSTHDMQSPAELVEAILSTSAVPPFMAVGHAGGRACLDGGLVDNPPTLRLTETEKNGGKTLLIFTRFRRTPPLAPNRTIVGPSEDITVNKFTIGDANGLRAAYELGLKDGEKFARNGVI